MDVNESIVRTLELVGVDHVFGGSGQVNASMLLALRDSEHIKTVIVRNEQGASFMACGYAMFSDKLGVCFATGGPGAFNLFSGMAVALSDSLPILGITGYTSVSQRGKGALNESTGLSRTPDSHAMFSATTKKSYIIEEGGQACDILQDAITTAFEGRPGPVHIHVPKDITVAEVDNFREVRICIPPVLPDPAQVTQLTDALAGALEAGQSVVLIAGYGVIRSHAEAELLTLVERFQLPFITTMDAKGVLPENHPLSLGVYGTSGDPGAKACFEAADMVLAIGNSFAQNATFAFNPDLYSRKQLLHINIDPHEIGKVYEPDLGLVSDALPAIVALTEALGERVGPVTPRTVARDKFYDHPLEPTSGRVHPAALVRAMSANLPPDTIVMGDAGAHMLWLNCHLELNQNQRYQNPGSFGPMASHVNGAIGVKCANPDKHVVCGCGDGGYLMAGFELLTAVEYQIPVVWVIFENNEFNIIKEFMVNMYGDQAYMQFHNLDFVAYARACGAEGYRVENLDQFPEVFARALAADGPTLITVPVEAEVYPPFAMGRV